MCLISEHAHALEKITELVDEIDRLKEQYEPELPANYPIYSMTWQALKAMLASHNVELMLKSQFVPDGDIFYTDRESWTKIIPFLTFPADDYVADAADCDDYARWASAASSKLFKLNGCLECWGHMPLGFHGFNLVITGSESFALHEPNGGFGLGELFEQGEEDYTAESWRL